MSGVATHFEQVPLETIKKMAKAEIRKAGDLVKATKERKRKVERDISDRQGRAGKAVKQS